MATASPHRLLCLCADDYGMDPGIDAGILEVLDAGLVRNVAIAVEVPATALAPNAVERLRHADLGLHLDLFPDSLDLTRLTDWFSAWSCLLPTQSQRRRQAERLDRAMDRLAAAGLTIRFLTGHQHVHLLPGWTEFLVTWGFRSGVTWFRRPAELGCDASQGRRQRPGLLALEFLGRRAARLHPQAWWYPSICRFGQDFEWSQVLAALNDSTLTAVEMLCHPGWPTTGYLERTRTPVRHAHQTFHLRQSRMHAELVRRRWRPARLSEWASQHAIQERMLRSDTTMVHKVSSPG